MGHGRRLIVAYCRWSDYNGYCDVYVYADVNGGYTTHVASARRPEGAPPDPVEKLKEGDVDGYNERFSKWLAWAEKTPLVGIDREEAGKTYNHPTPGECAKNLIRLRDCGFIVPQYAIDQLEEEQKVVEGKQE
jgi:hypothetical protein